MENAILSFWFTLSVILVTGMAAPTADRVSCQAGCYLEGDAASVQCTFNKDLNSTKHNFNVVRYPLGGATGDQQHNIVSDIYVLLCNWDAVSKLTCKTTDGYFFNFDVSTRLRVEIPVASRNHEGDYACQLVPTDGVQTDTCRLSVLRPTSHSSSDVAAINNLILIALFAAVILLTTGLFLAIFYICRLLRGFYLVPKSKKNKKQRRIKEKTMEEQELIQQTQTEAESQPDQQEQNKEVCQKAISLKTSNVSTSVTDSKSASVKKKINKSNINKQESQPLADNNYSQSTITDPNQSDKIPAHEASNTTVIICAASRPGKEQDNPNPKDKKKTEKMNNPVDLKKVTDASEPTKTKTDYRVASRSSRQKLPVPHKRLFCGLGEVYTSVQAALLADDPFRMQDKEVQVDKTMFQQPSLYQKIKNTIKM